VGRKKGNCFQAASSKIAFDREFHIGHPDAVLVHAVVAGTGTLRGINVLHAWVEDRGIAYDCANGKELVISVDLYRAIGKPSVEHRYTREQAREALRTTGHYGPWHKDFDEQIRKKTEAELLRRKTKPLTKTDDLGIDSVGEGL